MALCLYVDLFHLIIFKQAALNVDRQDDIYDKKKEIQDTEEGPEWIKELNKLVAPAEGTFKLKKIVCMLYFLKKKNIYLR
jgi:hypothetical protein